MALVKRAIVLIILTYSTVHAELRILENNEMAKKSLLQDIGAVGEMIQVQDETAALYKMLNEIIAKMTAEGLEIREDVEKFLQNPLNQLHFMNRYTEEWKKVEDLVDTIQSNYKRLQQLKSQHNVAFEEENGLKFLLDLADIYDLNVENLTLGIVQRIPCGQHLTADDCISTGSFAYLTGSYSQCEKWMTQAVKKIRSGENSSYSANDVAMAVLQCRRNREEPISPSAKLYKELCRRRSTRIVEVMREGIMKASNKSAADSMDFLFANTQNEIAALAKTTRDRLDHFIGIDTEKAKSIMVTHSARQYRTFFSGQQPYVLDANDYGVILFLSDVESGGATVFERPAVNVVPHRGNVLEWEAGLHPATCPVVIGDRWTAKFQAEKIFKLDNRKLRSNLADFRDLLDLRKELKRYYRFHDYKYDLF